MENLRVDLSPAELDLELRAFIADKAFPCVGAKSAAATGGLHSIAARDMRRDGDDAAIVAALADWAERSREAGDGFRSLAVIFREPLPLDEEHFEAMMWTRLQALAGRDAQTGAGPDPAVSPDPDHADFALSFGGEAFFIVGLHPQASRPGRRFSRPALIFNLHAQFVKLRADAQYDRMRAQIMKRDIALAGSPNPMLADHGLRSAARQYSGRAVGADWVCPFQDPRQ
ncbi:guanitoxin biosynthesis heme-dependent pre-guanitoxin N-hydroxylase GntA [Novosphingobium sp.]|uniref:guanitoxin biosynthesis heme-dependent pre-guanitoxin N-hydroxylase GntA n=1 Tax=Novosphingobium sp. TaxID=1874826 RepID=UPI002607BF28|nr:guanitoxin biosynthesis heme-dependent pre-guanitoxin N-hydroxylase GntA [Novosphingobium sp.]